VEAAAVRVVAAEAEAHMPVAEVAAACAAEEAAVACAVAVVDFMPAAVAEVVLTSAVAVFAPAAAGHASARGRRHRGPRFVRTPVATLRVRRFAVRDRRPRAIRQDPQDST
jgi:hypothetical protein